MEVKTRCFITNGDDYNCVSVAKQKYVMIDGKEVVVDKLEKRSFNPTEIEALKEFAPELEKACSAMWTLEAIKRWEDLQKSNNISFNK